MWCWVWEAADLVVSAVQMAADSWPGRGSASSLLLLCTVVDLVVRGGCLSPSLLERADPRMGYFLFVVGEQICTSYVGWHDRDDPTE